MKTEAQKSEIQTKQCRIVQVSHDRSSVRLIFESLPVLHHHLG